MMDEIDPMPSPAVYRTLHHEWDNEWDPWHYVQGCGCDCCLAWEDWILDALDQEQGDAIQEIQWWAYHQNHNTEE